MPNSYFFYLPGRDLRDEAYPNQGPERLAVQDTRSGQK
ncbi:hypothetical protein MmTuc01_1103 [Methanosarcina mazei Tuc01]|uniref:Uncharacterized protein n=1 Tax=Methanosarcina mazei Tuc01 TaxID=1236903 RepID=M1Q2L8_METMZ|nr:hypothetical protein MmTuc01_1103 [Methanosarcina mazei Tuc01]